VRLGAVTGVGHARLINERFGRFWGWFSVGDLFPSTFPDHVTSSSASPGRLLRRYLRLRRSGRSRPSRWWRSPPRAASSGGSGPCSSSFAVSWVQIPFALLVAPQWGTIGHNFVVPGIHGGASSAAVLLIIAHLVPRWSVDCSSNSQHRRQRITRRFIATNAPHRPRGVRGGPSEPLAIWWPHFAARGTKAFGNFTDAAGGPTSWPNHSHLLGALFAILPLRRQHPRAAARHPVDQLRLRGRVRDFRLPPPGIQGGQTVLSELHGHGPWLQPAFV